MTITVTKPGDDAGQNDTTTYSFSPGMDIPTIVGHLDAVVRDVAVATNFEIDKIADPLASVLGV